MNNPSYRQWLQLYKSSIKETHSRRRYTADPNYWVYLVITIFVCIYATFVSAFDSGISFVYWWRYMYNVIKEVLQ